MSDLISRKDAIEATWKAFLKVCEIKDKAGWQNTEPTFAVLEAMSDISRLPPAEAVQGEWISEIDTGTWMLKCSVCGCRVQEEKYRIAVGQSATKCPYCGAELGLGGYSYDEFADRPSQRGENHE